MAVWEVVIELLDDDGNVDKTEEVKLSARANTSVKTVALKALDEIIDSHFGDPCEVRDVVKSMHRQAYDWEDFADDVLRELDMRIIEPTILG